MSTDLGLRSINFGSRAQLRRKKMIRNEQPYRRKSLSPAADAEKPQRPCLLRSAALLSLVLLGLGFATAALLDDDSTDALQQSSFLS